MVRRLADTAMTLTRAILLVALAHEIAPSISSAAQPQSRPAATTDPRPTLRVAQAKPNPAQARLALDWQNGEAKFARGDYTGAIREYEKVAKQTQGERSLILERIAALSKLVDSYFRLGFAQASTNTPLAEASVANGMIYAAMMAGESESLTEQQHRRQVIQLIGNTVWRWHQQRANKLIADGTSSTEAADHFQKKLEGFSVAVAQRGSKPAWLACGYLWLGEFLFQAQLVEAVKPILALAAPVVENPAVPPLLCARYWSLKGLDESERFHYSSAFESHQKALKCLGPLDDRVHADSQDIQSQIATCHNNLGYLLAKSGDVEHARREFETAYGSYQLLGLYKPRPVDDLALPALLCEINRAEMIKRGDPQNPQAALPFLEHARKALEGTAPTRANMVTRVQCLNNLGLVHAMMRKFDLADSEWRQARQIAGTVYDDSHERIGELDVNMGFAAADSNDLAAAEKLFEHALEVFQKQPDRLRLRQAECMSYLARVFERQNRPDESRALFDRSLALRESYLQQVMASASTERERLAMVQELRVHSEMLDWPGVLDLYLDSAQRLKIDAKSQYEHVLKWKGIVLRHAPPVSEELESDERVQAVARKRDAAIAELHAHTSSSAYYYFRRADVPLQERAQIVEIQKRIEILTRELVTVSPRFRAVETIDSIGLDQIVAALPKRSALLDVIQIRRPTENKVAAADHSRRYYVAFIVRPEGQVSRVSLGGDADTTLVDNAIDIYYQAVQSGQDVEVVERQLSRWIREPVEAQLPRPGLLIVAADGKLHRLPLALLPDSENRRWLESSAITMISRAQSLVNTGEVAQAPSHGALLVGDVDYGKVGDVKERRAAWRELLGSREEIELLADYFQGMAPPITTTRLDQDLASEDQVRRMLPRHRYIHLATHGYFADRDDHRPFSLYEISDQLDSALVLAGANNPRSQQQDQLLTAEEISRLNLSSAQLVVLSGCETGLGHVSEGQGLIGLLGAFNQAGARTVLSSLWRVEDEPTQRLMKAFYSHLLSKYVECTPAEALRKAQLAMMRGDYGPECQLPRNWAGWTLTGGSN